MKKVLLAVSLPTIIGLMLIFFPRPVKAEVQETYHEYVIHTLWKHVIEAPQLVEELKYAAPDVAHAALVESPDCLVCQAMALMALRAYDVSWMDTLGEFPVAEDLDCAVISVVYAAEHEEEIH